MRVSAMRVIYREVGEAFDISKVFCAVAVLAVVMLALSADVMACHGGCLPPLTAGSAPPDKTPNPCNGEGSGDSRPGSGPKNQPSPGEQGGSYGLGGISIGDPINPTTGVLYHTVTDLVVKGVFPIRITRQYDSHSKYDSPVGYGWGLTLDKRLYKYSDGSVIIRKNCGKRDRYTYAGGVYQTPTGSSSKLVENADGTFVVEKRNGEKEYYDDKGRLTERQYRTGAALVFTYDSRGRLPLIGSSPYALDPGTPMVISYDYRLIKIEEKLGNGTLSGNYVDLTYNDESGRLTGVSASDGRSVTYQYDSSLTQKNGNLVQVDGLEGIVSTYQYNDTDSSGVIQDAHNITSVKEGADLSYINTFDAQDRVVSQAYGQDVFTLDYIIPGVQTDVTHVVKDDQGAVLNTLKMSYEYDARAYPMSITWTLTDGTKYRTKLTRRGDERVTKEEIYETPVGGSENLVKTTNYDYNSSGRITSKSVTLDSGETITKTWSYERGRVAAEEVKSSADSSKAFATEFSYYQDHDGDPTYIKEVKRRKADGSYQTELLNYDSSGRLSALTKPDGVQLAFDYVGNELRKTYQVIGGTQSEYQSRSFSYDSQGNIASITDANGNDINRTYDGLGRLISETNALGETTYLRYTGKFLTEVEVGHTTEQGEGSVTRVSYTANGWPEQFDRKRDDGAWETVALMKYDSAGNLLSRTAFRGADSFQETFSYDALGRLTTYSDAGNNSSSFEYDALGNRVLERNANGNETLYDFDDLGRLVRIEEKGVSPSAITQLSYDANGNLVSIIDPEQSETTYLYDALSRRTSLIQPLGQTIQYEYDSRDRIDKVINARGQMIDYSYYSWGGLAGTTHYTAETATDPIRTVEYTYDFVGSVLTVADDSVQSAPIYTYTYDVLNRVSNVDIGYLPSNVTLAYDYDRYQNMSQRDLSDGAIHSYTYSYNKINQLTNAGLHNGEAYSFDYYSSSDAIKTISHPSGVTTSYTYKPVGAVESINISGAAGTLETLSYSYDSANNILSQSSTRQGGSHDFSYDGSNRLTQALHPSGTGLSDENYIYDLVGNREDPSDSSLYDYDANHRILSGLGLTYSYDADGNLTGTSNGDTLAYDTQNRLIGYGGNGVNASYQYDPQGRRISKTVNGVTTWYLWDKDTLAAEYESAGNAIVYYAYLPGSYRPIQMSDSAGSYSMHTDHLATPILLTANNQAVVWSSTQQAFGRAIVNQDPDGNGVDVIQNHRFPGHYYDDENAMSYNYHRYYHAGLGRYVQSDPLGLIDGYNAYIYASLNPLRFADPFGLLSCTAGAVVGGIIGGAIGGAITGGLSALSSAAVGGGVAILPAFFAGAAVGAIAGGVTGGFTAYAASQNPALGVAAGYIAGKGRGALAEGAAAVAGQAPTPAGEIGAGAAGGAIGGGLVPGAPGFGKLGSTIGGLIGGGFTAANNADKDCGGDDAKDC